MLLTALLIQSAIVFGFIVLTNQNIPSGIRTIIMGLMGIGSVWVWFLLILKSREAGKKG